MARMAIWVSLSAAAATCLTATASADPEQAPDLSGYTAADVKDYSSYYNYPTTTGPQFVTPGGYRCRITYTGRANPPFKSAYCWGALPGTSHNYVGVMAAMTTDPAAFRDVDLTEMERYRDYKEPYDRTVSPDDYKPLAAGSKLIYPDTGTCAVTAETTICVVGQHGFELSKHSRVF